MSEPLKICIQRAMTRQEWDAMQDDYINRAVAAAARIEKLEAALREIAAGYETEWSTSTMGNMLDVAEILSERILIARKALEGKDDTA